MSHSIKQEYQLAVT